MTEIGGLRRFRSSVRKAWRRLAAGSLLCSLLIVVSSPMLAADAEPLVLEWEDLLPPGEEKILDQLYEEYFNELEQKMRESIGSASTLLDLALSSDMEIEEGSELDMMVQIGTFNVVPELDGRRVRLPGFIVPFDFSPNDVYTEFLFVPYFGACVHTPPPPPNQIVYVMIDEPGIIRDIYRPLWIEGVLTTERNENDLGDAAYTLNLSKVEPYEG